MPPACHRRIINLYGGAARMQMPGGAVQVAAAEVARIQPVIAGSVLSSGAAALDWLREHASAG